MLDCHPRLVALDVKNTRGLKPFPLAVAVRVDDPFGFHDFDELNFVGIVSAVGTVHGINPEAAGAEVQRLDRRREAVGTPPLHDMFWIGPRFPHKVAWGVEETCDDDFVVSAIEDDGIVFVHNNYLSITRNVILRGAVRPEGSCFDLQTFSMRVDSANQILQSPRLSQDDNVDVLPTDQNSVDSRLARMPSLCPTPGVTQIVAAR